jgi:hypothetical protein
MSAINVFAFDKAFLFPRTCYECVRITAAVADEANHPVVLARRPVVAPKWTVEVDGDGQRHLVARWQRRDDGS